MGRYPKPVLLKHTNSPAWTRPRSRSGNEQHHLDLTSTAVCPQLLWISQIVAYEERETLDRKVVLPTLGLATILWTLRFEKHTGNSSHENVRWKVIVVAFSNSI